jgi:2-polyprenyl-3-methyl-5-hydroxy-6-metoxy-1,4-benzoquinol methylase
MEELQIFKDLQHEVNIADGILAEWSRNYYAEGTRQRYMYDLKLIETYHKGGKILEIGAAPYHLTYLLSRKGYDVTGIDIAPERLGSFISRNDLNIVKCDIESEALPLEDNAFHYIIFNEIFEHLRINPIQTLREMNRVLHPDGFMALSTPNLYSITNIVKYFLGMGMDNPYEEFLKLETIQHMGHVREYSIRQVKIFLEKTGFTNIEVQRKSFGRLKGMWTPFNFIRKLIPGIHALQIHICSKT